MTTAAELLSLFNDATESMPVVAKEFDPSKHPREPKGSPQGGEFQSRTRGFQVLGNEGRGVEGRVIDSGIHAHVPHRRWSSRAPSAMDAYQFYSPNIEENLSFKEAEKRLSSPNQAHISVIGDDIDRQIGLKSRHINAIGDWVDGAENSIISEVLSDCDFSKVRYSAALKGEISNQKQVIPFLIKKGGADSLYRFQIGTGSKESKESSKMSIEDIRDTLTNAGIQFRTIIPLKNGGAQVYVFDPGTENKEKVERLAQKHDLEVEQFQGEGEFLGGDTRIEGRRAFERVRKQYEQSHPQRKRFERYPGFHYSRRSRDSSRTNQATAQEEVGELEGELVGAGKSVSRDADELSGGLDLYDTPASLLKFDPSQPRDPNGRWTDTEAEGLSQRAIDASNEAEGVSAHADLTDKPGDQSLAESANEHARRLHLEASEAFRSLGRTDEAHAHSEIASRHAESVAQHGSRTRIGRILTGVERWGMPAIFAAPVVAEGARSITGIARRVLPVAARIAARAAQALPMALADNPVTNSPTDLLKYFSDVEEVLGAYNIQLYKFNPSQPRDSAGRWALWQSGGEAGTKAREGTRQALLRTTQSSNRESHLEAMSAHTHAAELHTAAAQELRGQSKDTEAQFHEAIAQQHYSAARNHRTMTHGYLYSAVDESLRSAGVGATIGAGIGAATGVLAGGVGAIPGAVAGATEGAFNGAVIGAAIGTGRRGAAAYNSAARNLIVEYDSDKQNPALTDAALTPTLAGQKFKYPPRTTGDTTATALGTAGAVLSLGGLAYQTHQSRRRLRSIEETARNLDSGRGVMTDNQPTPRSTPSTFTSTPKESTTPLRDDPYFRNRTNPEPKGGGKFKPSHSDERFLRDLGINPKCGTSTELLKYAIDAEDFLKYSADQLRDDHGRWTAGQAAQAAIHSVKDNAPAIGAVAVAGAAASALAVGGVHLARHRRMRSQETRGMMVGVNQFGRKVIDQTKRRRAKEVNIVLLGVMADPGEAKIMAGQMRQGQSPVGAKHGHWINELQNLSGRYGLKRVNAHTSGTLNSIVIPNLGNLAEGASGLHDPFQLKMAERLARYAHREGITVNLITHSSGATTAAQFAQNPRNHIGSSVIIAPATRNTSDLEAIRDRSNNFTVVTSSRDPVLSIPIAPSKTPSEWARVLVPESGPKSGHKVTVLETQQMHHGMDAYVREIKGGRVTIAKPNRQVRSFTTKSELYSDQLDSLEKEFDPNQPRDDHGRWSQTGAVSQAVAVAREAAHGAKDAAPYAAATVLGTSALIAGAGAAEVGISRYHRRTHPFYAKVTEQVVNEGRETVDRIVRGGNRQRLNLYFLGAPSPQSHKGGRIAWRAMKREQLHGGDWEIRTVSNHFGLGRVTFSKKGNTVLLPNWGTIVESSQGLGDPDQARLAETVANYARQKGVGVNVIALSAGAPGAGEFARNNKIDSAVVFGPATYRAEHMQNIARSSKRFTLFHSNDDEVLNSISTPSRSTESWAKSLSEFPHARVISTQQYGHLPADYLRNFKRYGAQLYTHHQGKPMVGVTEFHLERAESSGTSIGTAAGTSTSTAAGTYNGTAEQLLKVMSDAEEYITTVSRLHKYSDSQPRDKRGRWVEANQASNQAEARTRRADTATRLVTSNPSPVALSYAVERHREAAEAHETAEEKHHEIGSSEQAARHSQQAEQHRVQQVKLAEQAKGEGKKTDAERRKEKLLAMAATVAGGAAAIGVRAGLRQGVREQVAEWSKRGMQRLINSKPASKPKPKSKPSPKPKKR